MRPADADYRVFELGQEDSRRAEFRALLDQPVETGTLAAGDDESKSILRGRLGAFERNTLQTNVRQLQITSENLQSAEAVIRDTDFAAETSELTRAQILVQAGNSILAIANAQSQNVLALLGG